MPITSCAEHSSALRSGGRPSSAAPQSATMGVSCHVCLGGGARPSRAPPPLFQPHCVESCSWKGGVFDEQVVPFLLPAPPAPPTSPSLSQQRMLGKEGGVRRCELWERTAAKKNTKLTWDHVTFSLAPTTSWTGRLLGRQHPEKRSWRSSSSRDAME